MKKFSPPLSKKRTAAEDENKLIEDLKLLQELREHYGLDEVKGLETWVNLSLFLARNFVPGFQHQQKRGRKADAAIETVLLGKIAQAMAGNDYDVAQAIKVMDADWGGRHYYEKVRHLKKTRPGFADKLKALEKSP